MNVRLRFNLDFSAGNWYNNTFLVNNYSVNIQLITQSQTPDDHPVCMGRIRTLFDLLENSVFIDQTNRDKIKELTGCGFQVVPFPQEPIDQIVGIVLFEKLNAVLDGKMRVTELDICSHQGDSVWFMHSDNESISVVPSVGWWTESGPSCVASAPVVQEKKIVKLTKSLSWKDFDLDWYMDSTSDSETVIINIKDDK